MPGIPNRPNIPSGGWRQQQAARLRAQAEAQARVHQAGAPVQGDLGEDRVHCVQEGDTIESLAERYGCSPESIRNHPNNAELAAREEESGALSAGENVYIPAEDEHPPQPVGQGDHVVKQGECISSIAKDTGHFWETIWNDPANEELKEVRENPNLLLPGDRISIPEKLRKEEPRETEQRHRFVRRGEPAKLRLRIYSDPNASYGDNSAGICDKEPDEEFLDDDFAETSIGDECQELGLGNAPRANAPYVLKVDDQVFEGITDADGCLEVLIPGNAKQATLYVGEEPSQSEFDLALGTVDPISEISGVQTRLNNLGFGCGKPTGRLDSATRAALRCFQGANELPVTGETDEATRNKLLTTHGS